MECVFEFVLGEEGDDVFLRGEGLRPQGFEEFFLQAFEARVLGLQMGEEEREFVEEVWVLDEGEEGEESFSFCEE